MLKVLVSQNRGFKVCHLNAQSLIKKIDEFRDLFEGSGVDAVCVSETWFRNFNDKTCSTKGYKVFRVDRQDRIGGGVAIYLRETLKTKIIYCSSPNSAFECLCLEILSNNEKLILGVIYRPYSYIDLSPLSSFLEEYSVNFQNIILCGDFNSNLLHDDSLVNSMRAFNLRAVNISNPTHFSRSSNTLLDVFFVSDNNKVLLYDQLSVPGFSRHDLIFLSYDYALCRPRKVYQYRDFNNIDYSALQTDIQGIDWQRIYYLMSPDEQVDFLQNNLNCLLNLHVPLKTKESSYKNNPWFNNEIRQAIYQRNLVYDRWKRFRIADDRQEYRRLRNICVALIGNAKKRWNVSHLSLSQNGRKLWKNLRDIGIGNKFHSDVEVDCNDMNRKFVSSVPQPSSNNVSRSLQISQSLFSIRNTDGLFNFSRVSPEDVVESFLSIKSKAVGLDDLHPTFLNAILPVILPFVTHLINTILTKSLFPSQWKVSKVIPIPKNNDEFRPISILPFISKVAERLMHRQITTYLRNSDFLSPKQYGFRANHSSTSAIIDVVEQTRKALDENKVTFLVLLDYSKAFDTIDHSIMCSKLLRRFNFGTEAVQLLYSYLTGRRQAVAAGGCVSELLSLERGVPQGSILGPLLFSAYINDLPLILSHCETRMFADDVQLIKHCHLGLIEDCVESINTELKTIFEWSSNNGLLLNPNKTKCLVISKTLLDLSYFPVLELNGTPVEYVDKAKNLGVYFNRTLTWNDHINAVVGKSYGVLRNLSVSKKFIPLNTRKMLVKSLVVPILTYGCEVYCNSDAASTRKLNVVFNNAIRYIYGLGRYCHISNYSKNLFGVTFENYLKIKTLTSLFNIIQTQKPPYLFHQIRFSNSHRNEQLLIPRFSCLTSERQFFINGIRLWNALPREIRRTELLVVFKRSLFALFAST